MQRLAVPRLKETESIPIRSDTRRRIKSSTASFQSAASIGGLNVQRRAPFAHRPAISKNERRSWFMAIAVAVMANLIAGGLIIYLAGNVRWLDSRDGSMRAATVAAPVSKKLRDAGTLPVLSLPARLEVKAGDKIVFPISLDGTDGVPLRSSIVVSGLPVGVALSEGRLIGDTWNLKSDEIGDLHLLVQDEAWGNIHLDVQLIGPDGQVIAAAETALVAIPGTALSPIQDTQDARGNPSPIAMKNAQGLGPDSGQATPSQPETGNTVGDDPATSAPNQTAKKDNNATWTAVTFANLREHPDSSARVLGVVSKGAKVNVVERKKGWLRVALENSKTGWVYSGFVKSPSGVVRVGTGRKKASAPRPPTGSFWQSWAEWLINP